MRYPADQRSASVALLHAGDVPAGAVTVLDALVVSGVFGGDVTFFYQATVRIVYVLVTVTFGVNLFDPLTRRVVTVARLAAFGPRFFLQKPRGAVAVLVATDPAITVRVG